MDSKHATKNRGSGSPEAVNRPGLLKEHCVMPSSVGPGTLRRYLFPAFSPHFPCPELTPLNND